MLHLFIADRRKPESWIFHGSILVLLKNMKERNTNPHIESFVIAKNKFFPNSDLPVLIYREAVKVPKQKNVSAGILQEIFVKNKWGNTWRDGIYDFHHFHSNTHECLGVAAGSAAVIIGGPGGKRIKLKAGDVLILPAGTGHKCQAYSKDFICVGGYPGGKEYDIKLGAAGEYKKAVLNIKKNTVPATDPVFGKEGFLKAHWK